MTRWQTKVGKVEWRIERASGGAGVGLVIKDTAKGTYSEYALTPALASALGRALELESLIVQATQQLKQEAAVSVMQSPAQLQ